MLQVPGSTYETSSLFSKLLLEGVNYWQEFCHWNGATTGEAHGYIKENMVTFLHNFFLIKVLLTRTF